MSGYKVGGIDLDDLYATYAANSTYSANFTSQSNNPTVLTKYQVGGSDLSTRYVEFSKLGSALKGTRPTADSGYKYYTGSGYSDIKNLYVAIGKIEWSAAIKGISSVVRTGTSLAFTIEYDGKPSKIDAYLTYSGTSKTETYGGTLSLGGAPFVLTATGLPYNTAITYTIRAYNPDNNASVTMQTSNATVYTMPEKPTISGSTTAFTTPNGTTAFTFSGTYDNVLNSSDNKKYGTVGNDSGCTNTSFTLSTAAAGTFSFSITPLDKQTGSYNTDLTTTWTLTVSAGTANWRANLPIDYITSSGFIAYVSGTNMYTVSGTATPSSGSAVTVSGVVTGGTSATVTFTGLSPYMNYTVSITVTFNGGTTTTLSTKTIMTLSNADFTVGTVTKTTTSFTIPIENINNMNNATITGYYGTTSNNITSGSVVMANNSIIFTLLSANTQYYYKVTGTGNDGYVVTKPGPDTGIWTLPVMGTPTIVNGDGSVTITLNGSFDNAKISNTNTSLVSQTSADGTSIFVPVTAYTFTVANGTYTWYAYLLNKNTNAYDVASNSFTIAPVAAGPSTPPSIASASIERIYQSTAQYSAPYNNGSYIIPGYFLGTFLAPATQVIKGRFTGALSCNSVTIRLKKIDSLNTANFIDPYVSVIVAPNTSGNGEWSFTDNNYSDRYIYQIVCVPFYILNGNSTSGDWKYSRESYPLPDAVVQVKHVDAINMPTDDPNNPNVVPEYWVYIIRGHNVYYKKMEFIFSDGHSVVWNVNPNKDSDSIDLYEQAQNVYMYNGDDKVDITNLITTTT